MSVHCFLPGHLEVLKLLVARGADVTCKDKKGYTLLHTAAASGQIEVVKHLLRLGVEASLVPASVQWALWCSWASAYSGTCNSRHLLFCAFLNVSRQGSRWVFSYRNECLETWEASS